MQKVFDRRTILVVDDDVTNRNVTVHMLKILSKSLILRTASNGNEALRSIQEVLPDIIILDLMMPEMDGYETLRELRSQEETSYIPVAVLTAFGDDSLKNDLTLSGCDSFLHKPVKSLELISIMHSLMRMRLRFERLAAEVEAAQSRYESLIKVLEQNLGAERTHGMVRQASMSSASRVTLVPIDDEGGEEEERG